MQISGELIKNKILIKKPKDVGRLYNKSHFGKIINGNKLELNLLEGVFLLGEGKIIIFQNKERIDFQKLIKITAKVIPEFEVKYQTFKDLRNRGHVIKLYEDDENISFYDFNKTFFASSVKFIRFVFPYFSNVMISFFFNSVIIRCALTFPILGILLISDCSIVPLFSINFFIT